MSPPSIPLGRPRQPRLGLKESFIIIVISPSAKPAALMLLGPKGKLSNQAWHLLLRQAQAALPLARPHSKTHLIKANQPRLLTYSRRGFSVLEWASAK
jgi:hypothetical protein